MLAEHPDVLNQFIRGKRLEGSDKAVAFSYAKAIKSLQELDLQMSASDYSPAGSSSDLGTSRGGRISRRPTSLAIVPAPFRASIPEQRIDDAADPPAPTSSTRTAPARRLSAPHFVSAVAGDMLDPTIRLLRALRMPCYRLLQALPVFLVLTVAAWFTVTLNYVAAHPELLVDIFFGALSGLPKYCDYAGQRILDRLLSKVSGSFWNIPENPNLNTTALEPGTPSYTIHWWLLGIPIAVFLSKGWGVG